MPLRAARRCRLVVGIGLAHGDHGVVRETRGATSLCLVHTCRLTLTDGIAVPSSFQLLFDFLAFKNDISFWKKKKSMIGMSTKAGRRRQNVGALPGARAAVDRDGL